MIKILVFTDLDGSLLNHYNYSWKGAIPALNRLAENSFPVIFTSSKTSAEILQIKQDMGNTHPCISENGAVVTIPANYFYPENIEVQDETFESHFFAKPYKEIIEILSSIRNDYHFKFRGFNDTRLDELVALTDLSDEQARLSKQREASEPILWKDTGSAFDKFEKIINQQDLIVTRGGRFYHVMSDVNKGKAIKWLLKKYQKNEPDTKWVTLGLGDSYNDIEMLKIVDHPVLIKNPGARQPEISMIDNLYKTNLSGPDGWNESVLELVNKII